jgi:hypothetical protein
VPAHADYERYIFHPDAKVEIERESKNSALLRSVDIQIKRNNPFLWYMLRTPDEKSRPKLDNDIFRFHEWPFKKNP